MTGYTAHEIFADEAADYLDKHNIYDLFGYLMKDLAISKPKDPLAHMITLLQRPSELLRVVVVGAPGSGTDEQVAKIVAEFQLVHIRVEVLLQDEIDQQTSLGAKVSSFHDDDLEVPDELITNILKARLTKSDCLNAGWVLDGYPTTSSQLHCMQLAGIMCNKFLVLECDEDKAKARAVKSGVYQDLSAEQFDSLYVQHARNVKQVVPLFPTQVNHFVDCNSLDENVIWEDVKAFCCRNPQSKAPRRPMRVSVIGPTGAGKQQQCTKLAHRFGLVHLSTGELLRAEVAKNSQLRDELGAFLEAGALVDDAVVSPIVIRRLLRSDCRRQGWVLDGFPRTLNQAKALEEAHLAPNRVVLLDVPEAVSMSRCTSRRIDPDTGDVYDMASPTPPSDEIAARLITQTKDKEAVLKTLLLTYNASIQDLVKNYESVMKRIDGAQNVDVVFDHIQQFYLSSIGAKKFGKS